MQVYVGDAFVGELHVNSTMMRHDRVVYAWHEMASYAPGPIGTSELVSLAPAKRHELVLPVKTRNIVISNHAIDINGDFLVKRLLMEANAPKEFTKEPDPARDAVIYSWKVLSIDSETHERLFDLDTFTPADSEPDEDYLHTITWNTGIAILR